MPIETPETSKSLKTQIKEAVLSRNGEKLLRLLENLYRNLTGEELNEESRVVLTDEINRFLGDENLIDMELPLTEGGYPHILIWREKEKGEKEVSLELKSEENDPLRERWTKIV